MKCPGHEYPYYGMMMVSLRSSRSSATFKQTSNIFYSLGDENTGNKIFFLHDFKPLKYFFVFVERLDAGRVSIRPVNYWISGCRTRRILKIMLPLSLLKAAENNPMLIELKNGDTYNGRLVSCNTFMNIHLRDVICTSRDGDRFWKIPECYIRGNSIKYLRIPEDVIERVPDDERDSKYRLPHNFILIFSALVSL